MHTSTRLLAAVAVAAVLSQPAQAQTGPDLVIALHHTGNFTVGVDGTYTIVVSNIGDTPNSPALQVTTDLPSAAGTGPGWFCFPIILSVHVPPQLFCSGGAIIPPGGSAPPNSVTVRLSVPGTLTNSATVQYSKGAVNAFASASDVTIVLPAMPTLPQWALIALTVCLALAGVAGRRRRTT